MPDEMNVVIESLRTHASKVDGVVDQLSTAVDASQQVSLDNSAYGVLCQPFAMMIDFAEQKGVDAVREAVKSMQEIADDVRTTAEDYQEIDDRNSELIRGVQP
ncbi:ESX-1 secretion-associated protein [Saccharopolyspora flava]|uniref:Excreted virulence factor EspC, type VII ESX diderm n=1 Tax=Saccharopolyspora flava TaxID=95161 RepID=A0A1I6PW96_9PSEU|nr:ESX-1 secretion-associated protein [Saccharopolyspora flava]SFS44442.1 Excreted virulence factor EspC, type VII ESX diderm [Saccharopolyspora flava]